MPQAIRAGMDCQTFWRSNPKRLKQFCDARKYLDDIDTRAWATGYYVAAAFGGKFPKKPDLLTPAPEMTPEEEAKKMALQFEAWITVNNQRFKNKNAEAITDG